MALPSTRQTVMNESGAPSDRTGVSFRLVSMIGWHESGSVTSTAVREGLESLHTSHVLRKSN